VANAVRDPLNVRWSIGLCDGTWFPRNPGRRARRCEGSSS